MDSCLPSKGQFSASWSGHNSIAQCHWGPPSHQAGSRQMLDYSLQAPKLCSGQIWKIANQEISALKTSPSQCLLHCLRSSRCQCKMKATSPETN